MRSPAAVCTASLGERRSITAPHRRKNPRRSRYIAPARMKQRMRARAASKWRIVARRERDGMLLNFTGEKLSRGGKPVIFPTRALALKFARYLRRAFRAKLAHVRLLILPA